MAGTFVNIETVHSLLRVFPSLQNVNVKYCPVLRVETFAGFGRRAYKNLQVLDIGRLDSKFIKDLRPMFKAFPNLRVLKMRRGKRSYCMNGKYLFPYSASIEELELDSFYGEEYVNETLSSSFPNLKILSVGGTRVSNILKHLASLVI